MQTASACSYAVWPGRRASPDIVLLDIGLPDMSGHEVCQRLRQHVLRSPLRIDALARVRSDPRV
jgi:DNA-binding response OmpR family regulator